VSADGLLAYIAEPRVDGRSLVWVDRAGAAVPALPETRGFVRPRLSPDERRLVVDVARDTGDPALPIQSGGSDVWVYHFENGVFSRLTNTGRSNSPFWTADGNRIAFRTGASIMWQAADGSGSADSLIEPADSALKTGSSVAPGGWSPDGHTLAFVVHTSVASGADIWTLNLGSTRKVTPVIERPGDQWSVRVSPDGRWISYASNESGHFEVYVEPLAGGTRHQISTDGGEQPIWSPRGDELFYRAGDRMLAAAVNITGSSLAAGRPHLLFRGRYVSTDLAAYDVTRDGKRFLMVRPSDDELRPSELSVVENWFEELTRLASTKP
jgi:Tol biopolymer transport system component